ncbi:MAG: YcjF family protein [Acholeplasmataceae bacterium]|nr:YcjF family protein [Acholeplasmataceae bacterium]
MKKKDSTKIFWYLAAFGFILLFLLMLLSSILDVGDRLTTISPYLAYGFYGLTVLLVYALILRPVHIILFSPTFSVQTTLDTEETSRKNFRLYKKVVKRLLTEDYIPEEEKEELKKNLNDKALLQQTLNHAFNKYVKKEINKKIKKNAKTVMISTAISQNGRLDFFTIIVVNLKMIKELVEMCGFRPSYKNLSKLTVNVFTTALIAEGLENLDLNDVLPASTLNSLGEIPLIKPVMSSVTQGISNALLTLRIGIVTRKYLFSDAQEITKEKIRRDALLEAAKMLPSVVGDAVMILPKKFVNLFKKNKKEDEEA